MNPRYISLALLAVNLGLAGALGYLIVSYRNAGTLTSPIRTKYLTNTVTQIAVRKVNATNNLLAALGNRPLSWGALESTNYLTFMDNLRAFGCPEETIRDLVLTDIARAYAKRRAALRAQAPAPRFWDTGDASGNPPALPPALQRALRSLEDEQEALVRSLLGVGFRTEMAKYWSEDDGAAAQISFLPADKQRAVQDVQDKYAALEEEIYARARGFFLEEDSEQLRQLARAKEAELAQTLTPAEFAEYQIRNSETAHNLRAQMAGFQPSEDEFRKLFDLQKEFDAQFGPSASEPVDAAAAEQRARAEAVARAALDEEMKKALGPERFAEYERVQDPDYRGLLQVTERFNLSRDVAGTVLEMKNAAERQKAQIEANAALTDEQRGQMLAAIARATEQSVAATLGDQVFKAYQKSGGQWLGGLLQVNENNLAIPPDSQPSPEQQLRNLFLGPPVIYNPAQLPRP